jgi:hypothetical protein
MCENLGHSNAYSLCCVSLRLSRQNKILLFNHFAQGLVILVQTIINKEIKIYQSIFIHNKTKKRNKISINGNCTVSKKA